MDLNGNIKITFYDDGHKKFALIFWTVMNSSPIAKNMIFQIERHQ